jgi:hypothetical protein
VAAQTQPLARRGDATAAAAAAAGGAVVVILPPGATAAAGADGGDGRPSLVISRGGDVGAAAAAGPAGAVLLTANLAASQGPPGRAPASQQGAARPTGPAAVAATAAAGVGRWLWAVANSLLVVVLPLCMRLVPLPLLARLRGALQGAARRAAGRQPPRPRRGSGASAAAGAGAAAPGAAAPPLAWPDAAPAAAAANGVRATVSFSLGGGAQPLGAAAAGGGGGADARAPASDAQRVASAPQMQRRALPGAPAGGRPRGKRRSSGGSDLGAASMGGRVLSWPDMSVGAPLAVDGSGSGGGGGLGAAGEEDGGSDAAGWPDFAAPAPRAPGGEGAVLVEPAAAARVNKKRCAAPGCAPGARPGAEEASRAEPPGPCHPPVTPHLSHGPRLHPSYKPRPAPPPLPPAPACPRPTSPPPRPPQVLPALRLPQPAGPAAAALLRPLPASLLPRAHRVQHARPQRAVRRRERLPVLRVLRRVHAGLPPGAVGAQHAAGPPAHAQRAARGGIGPRARRLQAGRREHERERERRGRGRASRGGPAAAAAAALAPVARQRVEPADEPSGGAAGRGRPATPRRQPGTRQQRRREQRRRAGRGFRGGGRGGRGGGRPRARRVAAQLGEALRGRPAAQLLRARPGGRAVTLCLAAGAGGGSKGAVNLTSKQYL